MSVSGQRQSTSWPACYGLSADPFDPSFSPVPAENGAGFARAYSRLEEALTRRCGYVVVTGAAGVGKTVLVEAVLAQIGAYAVVRTSPSCPDPCRIVAHLVGWTEAVAGTSSTTERTAALQSLVEAAEKVGRPVVVFVDDAHLANVAWLEALRIAVNPEPGAESVVQVVLAGRPDLLGTLRRPEARGTWTRVGTRIVVGPLSVDDAEGIVRGRLKKAGCENPEALISYRAIKSIVRGGHGAPSRCIEIARESLRRAAVSGRAKVSARTVARSVRAVASGRDLPTEVAKKSRAAPFAVGKPMVWGSMVATVAFGLGFVISDGGSWRTARRDFDVDMGHLSNHSVPLAPSLGAAVSGPSGAEPATAVEGSIPSGHDATVSASMPRGQVPGGSPSLVSVPVSALTADRRPNRASGSRRSARHEPDSAALTGAGVVTAGGDSRVVVTGNVVPSAEASGSVAPASPPAASFAVQVGAFRSRERARALTKGLSQHFGNVVVQETTFDGKSLYRVRLVGLPGVDQARALRARLRASGIDSLVVREP